MAKLKMAELTEKVPLAASHASKERFSQAFQISQEYASEQHKANFRKTEFLAFSECPA